MRYRANATFVMLIDGEFERSLESGFGSGFVAQGELAPAKQNLHDHPVRLFGQRDFQVLLRALEVVRIEERLAEAEARQLVFWKLPDHFFVARHEFVHAGRR